MTTKPTLVLVDGAAVFHRGYHAIPHLSNKDGVPTNATYGFTTILLKMLGDLKPTYVIVTWDKSSKTFRNRLYPEYKANRIKQPDDLYAQMPWTRKVVEALGIPWVELDDYEADDIIGTLAKQASPLDTVIVTGDKDELQLITDTTRVYTMQRGFTDTVIYDMAKMQERYGVTPEQFVDVKALKGDASDNIPGVPGVGEKTAMTLIQKYKSLDGVYEHVDEIPGKMGERIKENKDQAYLSLKLSRIALDAPVKLNLEKARLGQYDRTEVHELFRELNFKSLLAKLPAELVAAGAPSLFDVEEEAKPKERAHLKDVKYHVVATAKQLDELVKVLEKAKVVAFDTETDSVNELVANLVGLSFSVKSGEAWYVPVGHDSGEQLDRDLVLKRLKPLLEKPTLGKVGHNLKFDYEVLRRYDITLAPIVWDTMIVAFLINPTARTQSLDDVAYGELGIEMIPITELIGTGKTQTTFNAVSVEEAGVYAAEDADMAWRIYEKQVGQLAKASKQPVSFNGQKWTLQRLLDEIEAPIIPVLGEMEIAGIELDSAFLNKFNKAISKQILDLEEKICDLAGERFNINSPAQLSNILFQKLGLASAGIKKGKTGISTAAAELEKLQGEHEIVGFLLEYRELVKLKTTYVDALPQLVAADRRVHTSFNQTIAQTGRLSSTNPNLQNIPVRTEVGREIRRAFVAPKGRVLVSADYSQIELRVAAALSGDQAMIETFKKGVDLHQQTAAELFDTPLDKVTKEQRYAAKTINFGVLYGMSPHGLSVATGYNREDAMGFIKRYFEVRPQLAEYLESVKVFAHKHEYTETIFGRRRPCPEINSNNFQVFSGAERMAVNVPLQGTAADIYKLAMIKLVARLDKDSHLLLQIHDELIVEAPENQATKVAELMKTTMEDVYDLGVPLAVDTAIGKNWGEL